ncbi:SRPBCC family protein [Nocardia brevicatena]|uniref:SRPBCC family protein n=1 Tax=Nocardia brevicatena TaxID=37327 RepID=UPI0002F694F4|nr:SRPBCC family protein [Nocardia brevicatena]
MHFDATTDIRASADTVWRILIDVESWPNWTESMRAVQRLDSGEFAVGSRVEIHQPRLPSAIWTVTRMTPGVEFTWQARNPGLTTIAGHRLTERAGATRVHLTLDHNGPLSWAVGRATAGLTRRYLEMEAAGLAHRAEARPD